MTTTAITRTTPIRRIRAILASLPVDLRCDPLCPGWIVSEGNRGLRVERCDDCDSERRALGLPQIWDDDVRRLPEARAERLRMLDDRPLKIRGVTVATLGTSDGTASAWRIYRVPVRGYPRPIAELNLNRGTVIATPTFSAPADYRERQRALVAQYATHEWPAFTWPDDQPTDRRSA